jgi:PAS domain S-box-containing protein
MSASPNRRSRKILPKSPAAEPDLRHAMDAIPQLVWSAFPDGSVEFCNRRWLEYTGLTAEQAQGWGWRAAIHTEDAPELIATWNRVLAEGVPGEAEARMRKADGTFRWFLIRATPLLDDQGRIARWYGTNTEIEDRKRAEQARSLANDRLYLAMGAGASVGWDSDVKSGRDVWFGDLQTIFGIPSATYAASVEEFLRYVHPDDRQQVSEALADARQNQKLYAAEFRIMRPDGTVRWLAARGKFYYAKNGEPERMLGVSFDITERKLAEEKLREYEKAVEGSEEMIAVVNREYRYLIANLKFLNYRSMTKEQVVGRLVPEVLNKGVFETVVKEKLDECFRGKVVRYEMRYTYPELGERDLFISNFPIEGSGGVDRVACILQDITERKRTDETLRKSEERFRLAAQAGRMYAYEWDVATDIVMRSEEHVNVLGLSNQAKQLTRQQLLASVHPDDRALFIGLVDQLSPENPTTRISYRVLRPDGSVLWLKKNARAFFDEDGRMLSMIGMVTDITDHKQAEDALRESEDKLRLLLDSTAEAIYGIDLEGRCTFCNHACLHALGYERVDELLGKNMHDLIHHSHEDGTLFPAEECRILQTSRAGGGVHVVDEVLWRANGTSFSAEYWSYPQRRGQQVVGAVIAFIDITQRKLAEEALSSVSRRLIEAHEEERTRIARELHDDINQRLALVRVGLEQVEQSPSKSVAEVSSNLHELGQRISEISFEVQAISHRLHSSKLEYLGLVPAARSFCSEFSEQQKVEITFAADGIRSAVPQEISFCLFRVLQEALQNAVKHSGVRHFDVELRDTSGAIDLTVRDSGSGFDVDEAMKTHGLGLISMAERLKLVDGQLSIDSQPQRGTTIRARVPLSKVARAAS